MRLGTRSDYSKSPFASRGWGWAELGSGGLVFKHFTQLAGWLERTKLCQIINHSTCITCWGWLQRFDCCNGCNCNCNCNGSCFECLIPVVINICLRHNKSVYWPPSHLSIFNIIVQLCEGAHTHSLFICMYMSNQKEFKHLRLSRVASKFQEPPLTQAVNGSAMLAADVQFLLRPDLKRLARLHIHIHIIIICCMYRNLHRQAQEIRSALVSWQCQ